jgi:hypothetical protein
MHRQEKWIFLILLYEPLVIFTNALSREETIRLR